MIFNSQEKQYLNIFTTQLIMSYNLESKLDDADLRYGLSPFLRNLEQNS